MAEQPKKLHILVFPWLAFGHILPFYELAKLIAQKGHKISFISTPRNMKRLPKLPLNLQPSVDLIELPLPHVENLPQDAESTMDIPQHMVPYLKKAFDGLEEPLTKFLERSTPDWLIYDFAPFWLPPISSKLGILCISLCIFSATGASFSLNSIQSKAIDTIDESSRVLSEGLLAKEKDFCVSDAFRVQETVRGAAVNAIRSCMEIEGESINSMRNLLKKPVIPVGLLPPSVYVNGNSTEDENWNRIRKWLDEQEKASVIYVAFGSEVTLTEEEFIEITMGLELSGFPFFWVLKKKNSPNTSSSTRGIIWNTWAPQLKILAHKSVGGFLSHCGWSSVIESLQFGCPLIMLPFHNEQGLVAKLMEEKMVGVKVSRNEDDGKLSRDSLAKALRSVMLEDEGKNYRSHAEKMSKIVGDKELHQKYIDEFVEYMETHRSA
ncbi:hypothetical protein PIB30_026626 [Stylosanthes scabra]|uniref:Glycosyltransferase n=1 Tax=Stylosanthes scabra TaxID=79078 RepID=A0ABU6XBY2_9FABA|nr:hypothetical protein [Stylosanthes scabra]